MSDTISNPKPSQSEARKVRIFISYARKDDEPFVERLYHDLKDEFDIWWDRETMSNRGKTFLQEIRDAIDWADRLLLVAGPRAFTSDYVRDEWQYAYETYKGINIALRLGDYADFPAQLSGFDAPDFRSDADYDERLVTLKRQLAESVAPIGVFHNVPALPPHFLNRPDALDTLRELVIADVDKPTLISAEKRTTAVEGMGGIGKSALAAAFAHDRKVRFAFPDGIVWLTAGRDAKLYELYRAVGIALGDDLSNYPDETTARQNAQKAIAGKKCLLILDDLWELPVGRAFRDLISGTVTRLLITTRNLQINDLLNANEYRLKLIDKSQAADYLRSWAGDDPKLDEIAERLGCLFLALKLAGARMRKDNLSGADYLRIFDRVSRMKIDRNATDRDDSLEVSITLSVDAAFTGIEDDRLLYHTFGIFQEDSAIPQQTILQLWRYLRPDADEFDLLETLNALVDLALVERNEDRMITLHDLLHNYTREKLGSRFVQTHRDLLDSYKVERWYDLPLNEPYLWRYLAYHLTRAERMEELYHLLTNSPDWMNAKFVALAGDAFTVADIELALSPYTQNTPDQIIHVAKLWTARQVINTRASTYDDEMLKTMILIDQMVEKTGRRTREALGYARLRATAEDRVKSVLAIYQVLAENGVLEFALIEETIQLANTIVDVQGKVKWLCNIAAQLGQTDPNKAMHTFDLALVTARTIIETNPTSMVWAVNTIAAELAKHDPKQASAMAHALALCNIATQMAEINLERALTIGETIPDAYYKGEALQHMVAHLAKTDPERALAFAKVIDKPHHRNGAMGGIAKQLAEADPDRALGIAYAINNASDKAKALREIAVQLVQADPDRALSIAHTINGVSDKDRTLRDIAVQIAINDVDRAIRITDTISDAGYKASTLSAIAAQLAQIDPERAVYIFDQALLVTHTIDKTSDQAEALRDIATQLADTDIEQALTLAHMINNTSKKSKLLRDIGIRLIDAEPDRSLMIIQSITNSQYKAEALRDIAIQMTKTDLDRAIAITDTISDAPNKATALRVIATQLTRTNPDRAVMVFDRALAIARTFDKDPILRAIAIQMAKIEPERALAIVHFVNSDSAKAHVLHNIAVQLVETDIERALTIAHTINTPPRKAETLGDIAVLLAKTDLGQALMIAHAIDDASRKAGVLGKIATQLIETDVEQALEIAHTIADAAHKPLQAIAVQLSKADPVRALSTVGTIPKVLGKARALQAVVSQLAETDIEQALTIAHTIDNSSDKARALRDITIQLIESDLEQAIVIGETIPDAHYKAEALGAITAQLAQIHSKRAIKLFDQAMVSVATIPIDVVKADALRAIAVQLAVTDPERALVAAGAISIAEKKALALRDIAIRMADTDPDKTLQIFDSALTTAGTIAGAEQKAHTLYDIATELVQIVPERAINVLNQALATIAQASVYIARSHLLREIPMQIAQLGQFVGEQGAFAALSWSSVLEQGALNLFVEEIVAWSESLEQVEGGLSGHVLQAVLEVIAWVDPSWRAIREILAEADI